MKLGQFTNAATRNNEQIPAPPLGIGPALQETYPLLLAMSKGLLSGQGVGAYLNEGFALMDQRRQEREQKQRANAHAQRINSRLSSFPMAASSRTRGVKRPMQPRTPNQAIGDDTMAALGKDVAMSIEGQILKGLQDRGMSPHVAEAFVMNARDESGLRTDINEHSPLVPGSRGGYGLLQWTGSRRAALEQFAAQRGKPVSDLDTQLDFLVHELQGSEAEAGRTILSTRNRPEAATAIVNDFLRPAEEHRARRVAQYGGVQVASNDPNDLITLLADPMTTPQQAQAIRLQYEAEMKARQQANTVPNFSIQELADGRKYYIDPTGQQDPRLVAPNVTPTPDEMNFGRFKVVGNQLYDLAAEGGPAVVGTSQRTPGFSVTTPDGTTVTHGWQGNTPPGQNGNTTATPRNPGQLGKELSKKDAAALEEINNAARTATDIESLATQLETIASQVGYTGPGGELYGRVDDIVGFLPGDSGARGAFKSLAMEAQLTFTEKTKGAITDREMGMFRAAVPNLGQTQEGNMAIAQVMKAGAARAQTRAAFFENWARKHGSLEGAQEVWSEYMRDNPLIAEEGNGIKANPEGDWQSYLNRQPAMSYTPESILQMDLNQLSMVPVEKMTGPQLDALERRFQELNQ
ncbi:phage tail tip lysozyme [Ruegeria atlantica]|uniref:phage tail tip lysozyme n=1 Tax=Ruegeria atlantica TaxID=81569 RepID=UPI001C2C0D31|nr:phage tail tip lysozyme [Ruegeria atlantica]